MQYVFFFSICTTRPPLKSKFYYLQNLILLQHQCCVDLIQLATQLFFTALCGRLFSFFNIRVELSSYKSITTEMTTRYRIISYMNIVYKIWDSQLQVRLRYLTADIQECTFLSDKTWVDFATNKKASLAPTLAYVSIIICGVILGLVHTVS